MASNVIAVPAQRVTPRPDYTAEREHIAHLRTVVETSSNALTVEMGRYMLAMYEQERIFAHQNDNIIPLRRA